MTLADLFVKTYKYIEEKKLRLKQNKVNKATTDTHVSMTHSYPYAHSFIGRKIHYFLEPVV